MALFAFATSASALAAAGNGIAVTELPSLDSDSDAYVFGNAGYTSTEGNFQHDKFPAGLAYPVWDEINVPEGSKVKFIGGVALSSLPAGCTFDFSDCTYLVVTDPSVFGSAFTLPAQRLMLFYPCTVTVSGTTAKFGSYNSAKCGIDADLEINGTDKVTTTTVLNGAVTGSETGVIKMNVDTTWLTFNGKLDFAGEVRLGGSQRNERVVVNSSEETSRIGLLFGSDWGNNRDTQNHHGVPLQLFFSPKSEEPRTLEIGMLDQDGIGGLLEPNPEVAAAYQFTHRRYGLVLNVWSNNTIRVDNIQRHEGIHLMATSEGSLPFGQEPSFDEGFGNFEFVHLGISSADHPDWANRSPTFYPSPNVNLRFTGNFTGNVNSIYPKFDYTAESNTVNRGSLDTTAATVYQYGKQQVPVTGYSPWNLPRSIRSHERLRSRMTVAATDTRWLMPFDFGAEADEIDVARCETDLVLAVPASGTVVVSNATTAANAPVVPGLYPVITGNSVTNLLGASGAEAFANWTVELAGRWSGATVELETSNPETPALKGLWIHVKPSSGMIVIIR